MKSNVKSAWRGAMVGIVLVLLLPILAAIDNLIPLPEIVDKGIEVPMGILAFIVIGPCNYMTQCKGEECLKCIIFGPIIPIVVCMFMALIAAHMHERKGRKSTRSSDKAA